MVDIILWYPEYHAPLEAGETSITIPKWIWTWRNEPSSISLHLAIHEQVSTDSPLGIRAAPAESAARLEPHAAEQARVSRRNYLEGTTCRWCNGTPWPASSISSVPALNIINTKKSSLSNPYAHPDCIVRTFQLGPTKPANRIVMAAPRRATVRSSVTFPAR